MFGSGKRIVVGALASIVSELWILQGGDDDAACDWTWQLLTPWSFS